MSAFINALLKSQVVFVNISYMNKPWTTIFIN